MYNYRNFLKILNFNFRKFNIYSKIHFFILTLIFFKILTKMHYKKKFFNFKRISKFISCIKAFQEYVKDITDA